MSPNTHLDQSNGTMDTVIYGIGGGRMSDPLRDFIGAHLNY